MKFLLIRIVIVLSIGFNFSIVTSLRCPNRDILYPCECDYNYVEIFCDEISNINTLKTIFAKLNRIPEFDRMDPYPRFEARNMTIRTLGNGPIIFRTTKRERKLKILFALCR